MVHRDLKPKNILVTADGTVKLLDFGIAKLLNPELSSGADITVSASKVYTPRYASPEQVLGEPVSAATDVYALGVILYELLTGRSPYPGATGSAADLIEAICDVAPEIMSRAVLRPHTGPAGSPSKPSGSFEKSVGDLSRRLSGDLDAIVQKTLRKRPRMRYSSVEDLAHDLRCFLEQYPVGARKSTAGYRLGKLIRRHIGPVAFTAGLCLMSFTAALTLGMQRVELQTARDRAEAERQRAEEQYARAESVVSFLLELFEIPDPEGGAEPELTARTMLERGAEKLATELRDQPEVRARIQGVVGVILSRLGDLEEASSMLEASLTTRRSLPGDHQLEIAESLSLLGSLRIREGHYMQARRLYEEALDIQQRQFGAEHVELVATLSELGLVAIHRGHSDRSVELLERALEMSLALDGDELERAAILDVLASVETLRGETEGVADKYRKALEIRVRRLGEQHLLVSESKNNLAALLAVHGDLEEALKLYEEALVIRQRVLGDQHSRVATTKHNLAGVLRDLGNQDAAERLFRQAIDTYVRSLGHDHRYTAGSLLRLANLQEHSGRLSEAEAGYLEAEAILARAVGEDHPQRGEALLYLARLAKNSSQSQRCLDLATEASEIFQGSYPRENWRVAAARSVRAGCLFDLGMPERAEPLLRESLPVLRDDSDRRAILFRRDAEASLARFPSQSGMGING